MAAAPKVELDCDGSFSAAAALVLAARSREVFEHAEGVLDLSEIEHVHDMRVATRRLRAALEVFAPVFPRKRHRKALKRVKELADALGARRDADVEIELLECLADPGCDALSPDAGDYALQPDEETALKGLIADVRKRQRRANRELAPYAKPRRLKTLRKQLKRLVKAAAS